MKVKLPYGDTSLAVEVPEHSRLVIPEDTAGVADIRAEIRRAIDNAEWHVYGSGGREFARP